MVPWTVGFLLLSLAVINDAMRLSSGVKPAAPEPKWFEQKLDHNDDNNQNKWKQRYYAVDKYYKSGGPVFLVLTGEWTSTGNAINNYAVTAFAKKMNGMVFELEHRFYGESKPTSDLSLSNLRYLTIEHALADAASFIEGMNSQYKIPEGTKWIASGASYAGALVTWLRDKYPSLVYGSINYSGPVQIIFDYYQLRSHVQNVLKKVNKDCPKAVREGQLQVKSFVEKGEKLDEFSKQFKLCDPIVGYSKKDLDTLLESLADNFVIPIQYHHTMRMTPKTVCGIMLDESKGSPIDRYAILNRAVSWELSVECIESKYEKRLERFRNETLGSGRLGQDRQWMYQICTELPFFQSSYKEDDLVGDTISVQYYVDICSDVFGKEYSRERIQQGVDHTNQVYRGYDVKATRVVYVTGDEDPWFPACVTTTRIPESPAIVVKGYSHLACQDVILDSDPEEYKSACGQVETLVTKWCSDEY